MEDQFAELVAEILEEDEPVAMDARLEDFETWDSLAALSLLSMIDDEYEIIISHREFEKMETIGSLLDFIKDKMGRNS